MLVDTLFLSNNYIQRALSSNARLSPMKLQKILYFTYRDYLKLTGDSLFVERFSTWKYGPVIEPVYYKFKHYGSGSIQDYGTTVDEETGQTKAFAVNEEYDSDLKRIINFVWEACKRKTGIDLSKLTHKPEGAWYKAYQGDFPFLRDEDIQNDTIVIV